MEIAVVGTDAEILCRTAGVNAQPFPTLAAVSGIDWNLLALTVPSVPPPYSGELRAKNLLLPGDSDPSLAHKTHALQIIGYGFSPRDTLTLSSLTGSERILCLQRSLLTVGGTLLEPQELPLSDSLSALGDEQALLVAGLRLLCGAR